MKTKVTVRKMASSGPADIGGDEADHCTASSDLSTRLRRPVDTARHGGKQGAAILMARLGENLFGRALLDDAAGLHDGDGVGHMADDANVVADEHHGQIELALQVEQQVEHLRLHRHVERRDRFVADRECVA